MVHMLYAVLERQYPILFSGTRAKILSRISGATIHFLWNSVRDFPSGLRGSAAVV
jgi:hypothetical protein